LSNQDLLHNGNRLLYRNRFNAVRREHHTRLFAVVPTDRRLQNADICAVRAEADRAIEVIEIAIAGMARDDKSLAPHGGCKVRASAVVPDEQIAALEYGADFTQAFAANNERWPVEPRVELQRLPELRA
jgi:hypothetical protein